MNVTQEARYSCSKRARQQFSDKRLVPIQGFFQLVLPDMNIAYFHTGHMHGSSNWQRMKLQSSSSTSCCSNEKRRNINSCLPLWISQLMEE